MALELQPPFYRTEALAPEEPDSCGLHWWKEHELRPGCTPVAWRVVEVYTGKERAIYDSDCVAHEVMHTLEQRRKDYPPSFLAAQTAAVIAALAEKG